MRIRAFDFLFRSGHKNFNNKIIEYLSSFSEFKYYTFTNPTNNQKSFIISNLNSFAKGPISSRLISLIYMFMQSKDKSYDLGVVLGYDIITFSLFNFLYIKKKIILFHHENVDELSNKIKMYFFKKVMHKTYHIVLSEHIKQYLINLGVDSKKILNLPHPLYRMSEKFKNLKTKSKLKDKFKSFVSLGNSNDEQFIKNIIDNKEFQNTLKNNNIKLIIKSKYHSYKSDNLEVFSNYLNEKKYLDLIFYSSGCLLLYPRKYHYRVSGALFDYIRYEKSIFALDLAFLSEITKKYPNIIFTFNSLNELSSLLINHNQHSLSEIKKIKIDHSDFNISLKLLEFVKSI